MIPRPRIEQTIEAALKATPVCTLLGPRQCGKTTLARHIAAQYPRTHFFDLETAAGQAALVNPELALASLKGLVVIDEVQMQPDLYRVLRPLADRPRSPARFLLLGSASPELIRGTSESLAGRVTFVDLEGFNLDEVSPKAWPQLWLRGGFPRSYLARNLGLSSSWRNNFIRTFLEHDVAQLGIRVPSETLRRFWNMLAHYHAQIWNGAELARAFGVGEHSVRRYLDLLAGAYVLRIMPPWFENIAKRQNRAPKVYIRDSGVLHSLLGIQTASELQSHPKLGASFEGFALGQVLQVINYRDAYYWGTHAGAELDLMFVAGGKRYGVEFKYADAPSMTKSLHVALADLKLERGYIVYPGTDRYPVHGQVEVLPLSTALDVLRRISKRQ